MDYNPLSQFAPQIQHGDRILKIGRGIVTTITFTSANANFDIDIQALTHPTGWLSSQSFTEKLIITPRLTTDQDDIQYLDIYATEDDAALDDAGFTALAGGIVRVQMSYEGTDDATKEIPRPMFVVQLPQRSRYLSLRAALSVGDVTRGITYDMDCILSGNTKDRNASRR
jgi:hypothetical protein